MQQWLNFVITFRKLGMFAPRGDQTHARFYPREALLKCMHQVHSVPLKTNCAPNDIGCGCGISLRRKNVQFRRHAACAGKGMQYSRYQFISIGRIDGQSQPPVQQRFLASVDATSQYRDTASHRFQKYYAETLAAAGHDIGIREAIIVDLLAFRNVSGKQNTAAYA